MAESMPSVPMMEEPSPHGLMNRLNRFLDQHILPYPVKYLTNRLVIMLTLSLLIPLIAFANAQVFVLATNSYLNVMSVVVSSTVLLYSTLSEARDRAAGERREAIARQHEAMVEARAQADHELLMQIKAELVEHVNRQLETIQAELVEKLESLAAEDEQRDQARHEAAMALKETHRQTLEHIGRMVEKMQP